MRSLLTTHSSASTIEKMKLLVLLLVTILVIVRKSEESSVDGQDFVAVKLGSCPVSTGVGTCAEECSKDGKCPGREKCCSNGCGHVCMEPIEYSRVKSGNCPRRVGKGICVENCSWDDECPGKQKCCSNGCGHVCMDPYVFRKPKVCLMCCGPPPCCSYCGVLPDLRRRQQK